MTADAAAQPSSPARSDRFGVLNLSAVGAILIWSGTAPFSKFALGEFSTLAYTLVRPIVGLIILALILISKRQSLAVDRSDLSRLVLTGVVGIGLSQLSYTGALARTSVAHTVIIASTSPLLIAAYRVLIKRTKLPGRSVVGMIGGFAGVVILMLGAGGSSGTSVTGDLLALISAVTWMGATIWPAKLIAKYGSMRANLWMFGSALLLTAPLGASSLPSVYQDPPSLLAWSSLLYAALFGMVIGNFLWQRAVQQVGGAGTLIYLYLQPVGAMALAALFLGERLSVIQALGGVIALGGVALVRRD